MDQCANVFNSNGMVNERTGGNAIMEKSLDFAIWIVDFSSSLGELKHFSLKNQLFRSGTAIGALVREAQSPESKKDFVHKMKIAAKEADETEYWLQLCTLSPRLPNPDEERVAQLKEIIRLLTSIISTAKKSMATSNP